jgi:hypothetical protein
LTINYHFLGNIKKILTLVIIMYAEKIELKLNSLIFLYFFFCILTLYLLPHRDIFMSIFKSTSDLILFLFLLTLKEITF